jgi:RND family efflux transporter MFP subunit
MKAGTRIEETARSVDEIERMVRQVIPANQLEGIIDNLGIPYSGINTSYNATGTMSAADGDILVSLNKNHDPTNNFIQAIRTRMQQDFIGVGVWFPPADIVAQILNFGLPAPIDVQIVGADPEANFQFASQLMNQIRKIPGAVDFRIQEPNNAPELDITMDRIKASILGINAQAVANSVLGALAGSQQNALNFWVDPTNEVSYQVNAQVPQYEMNSLDALRNLPILGGTGQGQILANVAPISRSNTFPVVDHYNIRPVINIYGSVDGKDLGYLANQVQKLIDASKKNLPRGSFIYLRGQVSTMHDSFIGLYLGLVFSMLLVYLLMVVNFQSWTEPFIIITALPCALAGIVWMLFVTGTTLSVPALMGAIMCMGVATANSVLVVTFANERLEDYHDSYRAALEAGYARIRPVLMTAVAMIIGMVPMALGLSERGEQNAPLGRAVIGGLIFATGATLFFVPTVFMIIRRGKKFPTSRSSGKPEKGIRKGFKFFVLAGGVLFIGVAVLGIYSRNARTVELQQLTDKAARTIVQVVHPTRATEPISLQLSGQTTPYTDAPIFAQTSGYLQKWYFEIGAEVKTGAVLAEIDTPKVDAALAQAQAQLRVAEAKRDLSKVTYQRFQDLFQRNVIAAQDFDTASDTYGQDRATVNADQANVRRLEALEAFKIVRAPFDGIVTARNTDIGAFIPLGSGTELFRMARISPLRVYVDVPEPLTEFVKVGAEADLTVGRVGGRKYTARIVGTARAINPTAKKLLTELEVPNEKGELFPGAYVQVTLKIDADKGALTIPAGTLLFSSGKPAVGVVCPNGTVEIRKIAINRDLGTKLEVSQGLSESDQIIASPPPGLTDGTVVEILSGISHAP